MRVGWHYLWSVGRVSGRVRGSDVVNRRGRGNFRFDNRGWGMSDCRRAGKLGRHPIPNAASGSGARWRLWDSRRGGGEYDVT